MKIEYDKEVDAVYFKLSNVLLGELRGRLITESYEEDGITLNIDRGETKGGKQITYGIEIIGISEIENLRE